MENKKNSEMFGKNNKISNTINFTNEIQLLKRAKYQILLFVSVCCISVFTYSLFIPPAYVATSTLHIKSSAKGQVDLTDKGQPTTERLNFAYIPTKMVFLKSRDVLKYVIQRLNLTNNTIFKLKEEMTKSQKEYAVLATLFANTTVIQVHDTRLLHVSVKLPSAIYAAKISNEISDAFIHLQLKIDQAGTLKAKKLTAEKLIKVSLKLKKAQDAYREALRLAGSAYLDGEVSPELHSILLNQYEVAKTARITVQMDYNSLQETGKPLLSRISTYLKLTNNSQLQDLRIAYIQSQRKLATVQKQYGAKNLKVIKAKSERAAIQSLLSKLLRELKIGLHEKYSSALEKERYYKVLLKGNSSEVTKHNEINESFRLMAEKIDLLTQTKKELSRTEQALSLLAESTPTTASVVEYALPPNGTVNKNKAFLVVVSFILSLAFSVFVFLIEDKIKSKLTRMSHIESRLNLPAIGEFIKRPKLLPLFLWRNEILKTPLLAEAIYSIRIELTLGRAPWQVLGVTSAFKNEGGISLVSFLARAFSKDDRVLVMDMNFEDENSASQAFFAGIRDSECIRKYATQTTKKGEPNHKTLNQFRAELNEDWDTSHGFGCVLDGLQLEDNVILNLRDNLDFLPRGHLTATTASLEMFSSKIFTATMARLRDQYDRIVVAMPSLENSKNCLLISEEVDQLLLSVRADAHSSFKVKDKLKLLRENQSKIIGGVLMAVNPENYETDECIRITKGYSFNAKKIESDHILQEMGLHK